MIRDESGRAALVRALMGKKKAPKKDQPGLIDDAARLAEAGRYGDKIVAHITPEEAALLHARGGAGTINLRTGMLEFYDSSFDGGGQGNQDNSIGGGGFASDTTGGGGVTTPGEQLADALARGDQVNFSAPMADGGRDEGDRGRAAGRAGGIGGFNDSRGFFDRVGDFISTKANDARANPISTAINFGFGFVPGFGTLNTLSGLINGPTVGGLTTSAARGVTGYEGTPGGLPSDKTDSSGDKDSPFSNDTRGGASDPQSLASGSGGPLSQQSSALAQALLGNTPFNQGRKTFGPLVDSFDPNGRRYVTPWAYRG